MPSKTQSLFLTKMTSNLLVGYNEHYIAFLEREIALTGEQKGCG